MIPAERREEAVPLDVEQTLEALRGLDVVDNDLQCARARHKQRAIATGDRK